MNWICSVRLSWQIYVLHIFSWGFQKYNFFADLIEGSELPIFLIPNFWHYIGNFKNVIFFRIVKIQKMNLPVILQIFQIVLIWHHIIVTPIHWRQPEKGRCELGNNGKYDYCYNNRFSETICSHAAVLKTTQNSIARTLALNHGCR